jgi:hypothetical protein
MSPRALVHGEVIMVHEPQAGEVTCLSPKVVAADVGRPLGWPWVDPCRLNILGGLVSP